MDINYKITFHSLWHCGSGECKGADLDALVIKEPNGLPYIPGKTLKGLIKDGMQTIVDVKSDTINQEDISHLFGREADDNGGLVGTCFFTNASISEPIANFLGAGGQQYQKHLFKKLTSTAIVGETGVSMDHSLRSMEATIPIELVGQILNVPDDHQSHFEQAMQMIKFLGVGRNRGLGRCTFEIKEKKGGAK